MINSWLDPLTVLMDTRESAILNLALNCKEEWVGEMDIVVGTRQGVTLFSQFMMMSPADLTASGHSPVNFLLLSSAKGNWALGRHSLRLRKKLGVISWHESLKETLWNSTKVNPDCSNCIPGYSENLSKKEKKLLNCYCYFFGMRWQWWKEALEMGRQRSLKNYRASQTSQFI